MPKHKDDYGGGNTGPDARNKPSDLDGPGYSDASYRPGYPLEKSLKGSSENDLKSGFKKGG